MLKNWQKFSAWVMDYKPEYLHGGHLIDRAGYKKFKEIILDGVELQPRVPGGRGYLLARDRVSLQLQRQTHRHAPDRGAPGVGRADVPQSS